MAINNLLVPIDESEGAKRALDLAAELSSLSENIHIDLVYVVPIPLLDEAQAANFKSILDLMIEDGENVLIEARDSVGLAAEKITTLIITGTNPATEIIKLLEQRSYDMVIMGNRGLSGLKEYMGSVSHKVLNEAKIPVLIAK